MSWFPVDDAFHGHPKARKAGLEAVGLWTLAGSYCMAYLTDGFVPDWWVKEKPRGTALAKRLLDAGLWEKCQKDGEQGFQFHDWKPECTKDHVLDARAKARQRKAKQRESQRESRVTDGVSPASCLVPTQPNPTQPINPLVDSSGGVTQVDATDPRPECPQHEENFDGPCRACRRRREWDDRNAEAALRDDLERKRAAKATAAAISKACPDCQGTNVVDVGEDVVRKCDHRAVVTHA